MIIDKKGNSKIFTLMFSARQRAIGAQKKRKRNENL